MRKLLVLLMTTILLASCGSNPTPLQSSLPPVSPASSPPSSVSSSSSRSISSDTQTVAKPVLNQDLSDKLNKAMFDSFGGAGNVEFATSWYKFLDKFEVFENGDTYTATLKLTEEPADATVRMMLSSMLTNKNLEYCLPAILDTGASLGLDEIDMCLVGENISKILSEEPNLGIIYASLYAYEIPVYKYLADALELSQSDIMTNIELCTGATAAQIIVDGMSADYGGSFKGFTLQRMETAARAAMTSCRDVYLSEITVFGPEGKELKAYKNLVPKK